MAQFLICLTSQNVLISVFVKKKMHFKLCLEIRRRILKWFLKISRNCTPINEVLWCKSFFLKWDSWPSLANPFMCLYLACLRCLSEKFERTVLRWQYFYILRISKPLLTHKFCSVHPPLIPVQPPFSNSWIRPCKATIDWRLAISYRYIKMEY